MIDEVDDDDDDDELRIERHHTHCHPQTPSDVCLNMMPLFHIGGIVRNVLCPVLTGGAVLCCGGFDPLLFWDLLSRSGGALVTW